MNIETYNSYIKILESELKPAMGCTEPIAIALASAKCREVLGRMPEKIVATCSGNIIKNVKAVLVPNSNGQKGVEAAAILGAVAGKSELELEVISKATKEDAELTRKLVKEGICTVKLKEGVDNLYINIEQTAGDDKAIVEVVTKHDNITYIEKNGEILLKESNIIKRENTVKELLNLKDIYEFANNVKIEDVYDVIKRQIDYNNAIADEGLKNEWGEAVGKTTLEIGDDSVRTWAIARAAAGSDARMNGCALPVVINAGSGNQGMTCAIPVCTYTKELRTSEEKLIRALVLTNLIAIHQKRYIGDLSAYCGAVSAGAAAGCGIAYLYDESFETIEDTLSNTLATTSGMICDGAKSSCAAKIVTSVSSAIMGYEMAKRGRKFRPCEGIVACDTETTVKNVGHIAKEGMKQTDIEIINIMNNNIAKDI
ncbi:MAG: L-serine ammonia-lyase, iron-sulfur-dependent, subunit alpha [Ezakiella sp.]|nr:L-serine ammonia-lyase, iron-sulfur-dependent, subunit alpha [Ezakiella sp.]MDD7471384.1 L-serine ammonia-lyase, iron-sulfur-dependent, subunit alpha [Bacillota bacterium]MDY3922881.1 L-serine ammonia-lyase, iron-sulfur-dependent, subunit alpha [Ezakiella sp.]